LCSVLGHGTGVAGEVTIVRMRRLLAVAFCSAVSWLPTTKDEMQTLAPTGKLRAALYLGGPTNVVKMPHDSPPCMRLCPADPGNPRRYIEGESPRLWRGTYSLRGPTRTYARVRRHLGSPVEQ